MRMKRTFRRILVTGASGYIGNHCIIELLSNGYEVIALDNFTNSIRSDNEKPVSIERVEQLCGKTVTFYNFDLQDEAALNFIFMEHEIDCVIYLISISKFDDAPLMCYESNLSRLSTLIRVLKERGCQKLIYSSSCVVYGNEISLPISESHVTGKAITTTHGRNKHLVEHVLTDICKAKEGWNIITLRHFNVFGTHPSGLIGYHPKNSTGLMSMISKVATRKETQYKVLGGNYDTPDGSAIRDYVHVMDVAAAYVAAITKLQCEEIKSMKVYNLGSGVGTSVFELIEMFKKVSGDGSPVSVLEKRAGDVTSIYADTKLTREELKWTPKRSLEQACVDFWKWITKNPNGYDEDV